MYSDLKVRPWNCDVTNNGKSLLIVTSPLARTRLDFVLECVDSLASDLIAHVVLYQTVLTVISGGPGPQRDHRQQPMIHKAFDLPIEGGVQGSAETQRHHPQHVSGDAVYVVRDRECRARRDPQVTTEKAGPRSSLPPYSTRPRGRGPGSSPHRVLPADSCRARARGFRRTGTMALRVQSNTIIHSTIFINGIVHRITDGYFVK